MDARVYNECLFTLSHSPAMFVEVKKSDVRELYPFPEKDSHKGDNGRVMIVGGSTEYYGAPILCGMGALFGGADLVTLMVPECNFEVSRGYYPDFIVRSFPGERLTPEGVPLVLEAAEGQDAVVIGPGLGTRPETLEAVAALGAGIHGPLVLDTSVAQAVAKALPKDSARIAVLSHGGDFYEMFGDRLPLLLIERFELVKQVAARTGLTVFLKGSTDIIAGPGNNAACINQTGNPGMTSGGTGDVLAGLVGRLLAGGLSPYDAARLGAFIAGSAGDELAVQKGHAFTATNLAHQLPYTIRNLLI